MSLVLAVDIGTGSCRSALYNQQLQCLSNEVVEYTTRYPQPDWAEQDPEVIFLSVLRAIEGTISKSDQDPSKIVALTLDCSIHTLLALDKDLLPVTPDITWEDSVLSLAGISGNQLPPVVDPTVSIESIRPEISHQTGLPVSTRVIIGSSDAAMSSLDSGTVDSDQMTVMIGTSGAVRRLVGCPTMDLKQRTFCYYMGSQWWLAGGAINNGGIALRWFR